MTARQKEHAAGYRGSTDLMPGGHADSQADGLRALLAIAVNRAGDLVEETAVRNGRALTVLENLAPELDVSALPPAEPTSGTSENREQKDGRVARGRHAAAPPPYLERRGSRFVVFSAIGGAVFLMGLGLQAALTGVWHVQPVVSYMTQAVVSVETSFLLNRWLTWRDRGTAFWVAFARFNAQKTVTIALNLVLYVGLLHLGMNYLVANVALTCVFTVVNYVAGDRLVFVRLRTRRTQPEARAVSALVRTRVAPRVSVVIPCKNNEGTIGATVQCLLEQDYPQLIEIILIGSPGDHTWEGVADPNDPKLAIYETETPPGVRDANFKRDAAIRMASGDLIALVDSDIVLPRNWMSLAVTALEESGASCVAGGMKSIHDSFWGRYTDSTWIGAKTPRVGQSYSVTSTSFGARGRKPPITANTLFTRELYNHCPIDPSWSHGSYEDYEWFWRVAMAGYKILVCQELFGWHHHRRGLGALIKEYRRSSRGCAYFIRAHRDSPFAKRRLRQVIILPLAAVTAAATAAAAASQGHSTAVGAAVLGCAAVLTVHQIVRSRSLESLAYPAVGLTLGLVFITGLATNLIQSGPVAPLSPADPSPAFASGPRQPPRAPRRRLLYPLTAICAVQVALSLTLIWSNTAYIDEANFLWVGRLEIAHWMHGASWPSTYAYRALPGSPTIYPPLGALADSMGGLAGARLLSLALMVGATVLLCLSASKLIGRTGALIAAALWALSEPVMRLAFATSDPLSIFLTALSAWLIAQAGHRRHRGELILAAAVSLGLANAAAYSGIVIDPVVIAFAFLAWTTCMRTQQSLSCAAWLAAAWALSFCLLMTASHSWPGLFATIFGSSNAGYQGISPSLGQIWAYAGLIIGLALLGAAVTLQSHSRNHAALLGGLSFAIFALAQARTQTPWSLDKHLAYGIWFAAISAGYACSRLILWLPSYGAKRPLAALCCAAAFAYPAATSWQSAWQRYHAWPNANEFVGSFKRVAIQSKGLLYLPGHEANIAQYYAPRGIGWARWSGALSLDSTTVPKNPNSYYSAQLRSKNYGVIALFYSTTFSSVRLPGKMLLPSQGRRTYQELLSLVGDNSGDPGLPALTSALESDPEYRIAATGHYNTSNISGTHDYGFYAIWQKKGA